MVKLPMIPGGENPSVAGVVILSAPQIKHLGVSGWRLEEFPKGVWFEKVTWGLVKGIYLPEALTEPL